MMRLARSHVQPSSRSGSRSRSRRWCRPRRPDRTPTARRRTCRCSPGATRCSPAGSSLTARLVHPLDKSAATALQDSSTQANRKLQTLATFVRTIGARRARTSSAPRCTPPAAREERAARRARTARHRGARRRRRRGRRAQGLLRSRSGRSWSRGNPNSYWQFVRGFSGGDAYRSFPSGHTVAAFAAAAAVTAETSRWWPKHALDHRARDVRRRGARRALAHVQQPPLGERRDHRRGDRHLRRPQGGALQRLAHRQPRRPVLPRRLAHARHRTAVTRCISRCCPASLLGLARERRRRGEPAHEERDLHHRARSAAPVGERIAAVQAEYDPRLARLGPPHVTLAGSSGMGPDRAATPRRTSSRAPRPDRRAHGADRAPLRARRRGSCRRRSSCSRSIRTARCARCTSASRRAASARRAPRFFFTPHVTLSLYREQPREAMRALLADALRRAGDDRHASSAISRGTRGSRGSC